MDQNNDQPSESMKIALELIKDQKFTPEELCLRLPNQKLNIVFDVDHTLIYSISVNEFPQLGLIKQSDKIWDQRVHYIQIQGYPMWIVVRYGVPEMLEYLHTFCNFFVYSHGLKSYVHEILKKLDPENKYFKDREKTFLAPIDAKMQNEMNQNRKSMTDFKDPKTGQNLFTQEDLDKTFIIDDQIGAIKETEHLIISKKFLKFFELYPQQHQGYGQYQNRMFSYQFPHKLGNQINPIYATDQTLSHQDYNRVGEANQLYSISNLLTRIFLHRALLEPKKPVTQIFEEFRKQIFAGLSFYFHDFIQIGCDKSQIEMTPQELYNAENMRISCYGIVIQLGGKIVEEKSRVVQATHIVLYQRKALSQRLEKYKKQHVVYHKWITECYFQQMRLNLDGDEECNSQSFLVQPVFKSK